MDESFGKLEETMDSDFKNLKGTIDNTPKGIKVSPNTEESRKEIEIREYQGVMLSENKNSHNKKDVQTVEKKTKKIIKTCRKRIINTCLLYTSRCV